MWKNTNRRIIYWNVLNAIRATLLTRVPDPEPSGSAARDAADRRHLKSPQQRERIRCTRTHERSLARTHARHPPLSSKRAVTNELRAPRRSERETTAASSQIVRRCRAQFFFLSTPSLPPPSSPKQAQSSFTKSRFRLRPNLSVAPHVRYAAGRHHPDVRPSKLPSVQT